MVLGARAVGLEMARRAEEARAAEPATEAHSQATCGHKAGARDGDTAYDALLALVGLIAVHSDGYAARDHGRQCGIPNAERLALGGSISTR